jgi:hypothetical protein
MQYQKCRTSPPTLVWLCKRVVQLLARRTGPRAFRLMWFFRLVQWPLLRNFPDQLSRSRVEACLLLVVRYCSGFREVAPWLKSHTQGVRSYQRETYKV